MIEITAEIRALIDKAAAGMELAGDEYIDPADGLMPIVHQLVEKMGGSITVESLPGKGTEFMLLFPLES